MQGTILSVSAKRGHHFSKSNQMMIDLVAGHGVAGDGHYGETVQHRSRKRFNPSLPNLRQVHLIAQELIDELNGRGFIVGAGDLGENITTKGLDLIALSTGTKLQLGAEAIIEITGLRNPCIQMDRFQQGLMAAVLDKDFDGNLIRRAGVMAIVSVSGAVFPNDEIVACHVPLQHEPLKPV
jgi:MOSC domain-containing protein YiiM